MTVYALFRQHECPDNYYEPYHTLQRLFTTKAAAVAAADARIGESRACNRQEQYYVEAWEVEGGVGAEGVGVEGVGVKGVGVKGVGVEGVGVEGGVGVECYRVTHTYVHVPSVYEEELSALCDEAGEG